MQMSLNVTSITIKAVLKLEEALVMWLPAWSCKMRKAAEFTGNSDGYFTFFLQKWVKVGGIYIQQSSVVVWHWPKNKNKIFCRYRHVHKVSWQCSFRPMHQHCGDTHGAQPVRKT